MGNCECLRNPEDPSTEIHANVKLRNYDNDYESTVKGRAKNVNNFILNDEDDGGNKNSEPPIKEDNILITTHEEPIKEETHEDFAMTFNKKEKDERQVVVATQEEVVDEKPLDKSLISGESDIEGGKLILKDI